MERFIILIEDPGLVEQLEIAVRRRESFRRFTAVLERWPGLLDEWNAFSEERQRGRVRSWLATQGYQPTPRPTTN